MPASYADVLPLVAPRLPVATLGAEARASLRRMASGLPPILQGGFEVRLPAEGQRVDLHQRIAARDAQPESLLEWLRASRPTGPGWDRLTRFCDAWVHLPLDLSEVWLELDAREESGASPSPSVFVGLAEGRSQRETAEKALRLLLGAGPSAGSWEGVARCFSACAGAARVSHVGAMLGRTAPTVRVNVKGVAPGGAARYLGAAGWQGPVTEALDALRWLTPLVEKVTFCLDIGPDAATRPGLGLECSFPGSPDDDAGWRGLLDALVARDLCAPGARDAVLAWPELLVPAGRAERWPATLVKASLTASPTQFTAVNCRISHVKVSVEPGRPLTTKAYLWFGHAWLTAGASAPASTGVTN